MSLPYAGQEQRDRNILETPPAEKRVASEFQTERSEEIGLDVTLWWMYLLVICDNAKEAIRHINPYPTAFPYGNGMVLHFYQQQESSTTKTVHKVINKGLKAYV